MHEDTAALDVIGPVGMAAALVSLDTFQWAPEFPRFVYPNGMSVTEWDRTMAEVL